MSRGRPELLPDGQSAVVSVRSQGHLKIADFGGWRDPTSVRNNSLGGARLFDWSLQRLSISQPLTVHAVDGSLRITATRLLARGETMKVS
jgi:hypothetical protein